MLAISKLLAFASVQNNQCDPVSPLAAPLETDRYMGTWYEIQHSHGAPFLPDKYECTTSLYSDLNAEAGTFKVYDSYKIGFLPRIGVHGLATIAG